MATVQEHGGQFVPPDNLLHPESLSYLVEAVEAEYFGQEMYPTIPDKAGVYFFSIISNHMFQDGNKRTGLTAAFLFLFGNGYDLTVPENYSPVADLALEGSLEEKYVFEFAIEVASGQRSLDDVRLWFTENTVTR